MGLTRTIPPPILPVTLAEIKGQLNLALDDQSRDARLLALGKAATNLAERVTGRSFVNQTWRLSIDDRFPVCARILLPRPPVQSITSVQYTDTAGASQTLGSSLYRLASDSQPPILEPAYGETWPSTQPIAEAVRITYKAGYGGTSSPSDAASLAAVPEDAKLAILLAIQSWFDMPLGSEQTLPGGALNLLRSLKVGQYAPTYAI